jgi:hypothetical protein
MKHVKIFTILILSGLCIFWWGCSETTITPPEEPGRDLAAELSGEWSLDSNVYVNYYTWRADTACDSLCAALLDSSGTETKQSETADTILWTFNSNKTFSEEINSKATASGTWFISDTFLTIIISGDSAEYGLDIQGVRASITGLVDSSLSYVSDTCPQCTVIYNNRQYHSQILKKIW